MSAYDKYRLVSDTDEQWFLKQSFILSNLFKFSEERLVCLAQIFSNMLYLDCIYPVPIMELVRTMSRNVLTDRFVKQRTRFHQLIDEAVERKKQRLGENTIEHSTTVIEESSLKYPKPDSPVGGDSPVRSDSRYSPKLWSGSETSSVLEEAALAIYGRVDLDEGHDKDIDASHTPKEELKNPTSTTDDLSASVIGEKKPGETPQEHSKSRAKHAQQPSGTDKISSIRGESKRTPDRERKSASEHRKRSRSVERDKLRESKYDQGKYNRSARGHRDTSPTTKRRDRTSPMKRHRDISQRTRCRDRTSPIKRCRGNSPTRKRRDRTSPTERYRGTSPSTRRRDRTSSIRLHRDISPTTRRRDRTSAVKRHRDISPTVKRSDGTIPSTRSSSYGQSRSRRRSPDIDLKSSHEFRNLTASNPIIDQSNSTLTCVKDVEIVPASSSNRAPVATNATMVLNQYFISNEQYSTHCHQPPVVNQPPSSNYTESNYNTMPHQDLTPAWPSDSQMSGPVVDGGTPNYLPNSGDPAYWSNQNAAPAWQPQTGFATAEPGFNEYTASNYNEMMPHNHPAGSMPGMMAHNHPAGSMPGMMAHNHPAGSMPGVMAHNHPNGSMPGMMNHNHPSGSMPGMMAHNNPGGGMPGMMNHNHPSGSMPGMMAHNNPGGGMPGMMNHNHPSGSMPGMMAHNNPGGGMSGMMNHNNPGGGMPGMMAHNNPGGGMPGMMNHNNPGGGMPGMMNHNNPGGGMPGMMNHNHPSGSMPGMMAHNNPGGGMPGMMNHNNPGVGMPGMMVHNQPNVRMPGMMVNNQPNVMMPGMMVNNQPNVRMPGMMVNNQPNVRMPGILANSQPNVRMPGMMVPNQPNLGMIGMAQNQAPNWNSPGLLPNVLFPPVRPIQLPATPQVSKGPSNKALIPQLSNTLPVTKPHAPHCCQHARSTATNPENLPNQAIVTAKNPEIEKSEPQGSCAEGAGSDANQTNPTTTVDTNKSVTVRPLAIYEAFRRLSELKNKRKIQISSKIKDPSPPTKLPESADLLENKVIESTNQMNTTNIVDTTKTVEDLSPQIKTIETQGTCAEMVETTPNQSINETTATTQDLSSQIKKIETQGTCAEMVETTPNQSINETTATTQDLSSQIKTIETQGTCAEMVETTPNQSINETTATTQVVTQIINVNLPAPIIRKKKTRRGGKRKSKKRSKCAGLVDSKDNQTNAATKDDAKKIIEKLPPQIKESESPGKSAVLVESEVKPNSDQSEKSVKANEDAAANTNQSQPSKSSVDQEKDKKDVDDEPWRMHFKRESRLFFAEVNMGPCLKTHASLTVADLRMRHGPLGPFVVLCVQDEPAERTLLRVNCMLDHINFEILPEMKANSRGGRASWLCRVVVTNSEAAVSNVICEAEAERRSLAVRAASTRVLWKLQHIYFCIRVTLEAAGAGAEALEADDTDREDPVFAWKQFCSDALSAAWPELVASKQVSHVRFTSPNDVHTYAQALTRYAAMCTAQQPTLVLSLPASLSKHVRHTLATLAGQLRLHVRPLTPRAHQSSLLVWRMTDQLFWYFISRLLPRPRLPTASSSSSSPTPGKYRILYPGQDTVSNNHRYAIFWQ